jgi:hypothetical protein
MTGRPLPVVLRPASVALRLDPALPFRHDGVDLAYRTFDKLRRVTETAVLENKRLGGLLTLIRENQQTQPSGMRTSKGPKRRDQTNHMFSVG